MDNSRYGGPSQEYLAFHQANPQLDALHDNHAAQGMENPALFRESVNSIREDLAKKLYAQHGFDKSLVTTDFTVTTRDGTSLPLRSYRPAAVNADARLPACLYFHGGGMMFGSIGTEHFFCGQMCSDSGYQILHVEYRHTPAFTYPTALHDAWDAFEWVIAHADELAIDPAKLVVGGVSAGGCLTSSVVYQEVALARSQQRPLRVRGQLLAIPNLIYRDVYPYELFASRDVCSMVECADSAILPRRMYDTYTDIHAVHDVNDKLINVGLASQDELRGMPPTVIVACGWDMLRDEAFVLADKLEKLSYAPFSILLRGTAAKALPEAITNPEYCSVPTKKHVFTGLPHYFWKFRELKSSQRLRGLVGESLRWLVEGSDANAPGVQKGVWEEEIPEEFTR